jgi:hypothetical protein
MPTPYITPKMLLAAPTGISWRTMPAQNSTNAQELAAQTDICWRATSMVDTFCNQVLRATVDNEQLTGPGNVRVGIQQGSGVGLLIMRRWPVTQVLAIQTSLASAFPRVWSAVPSGKYAPTNPLINMDTDSASATAPDGGMSISVAPGYINWSQGRNGLQILASYVNGWPHTSLTADSDVGVTTLAVDDVTGFDGAQAFIYDGGDTETVSVESVAATTPLPLPNGVGTAQAGPGTLTLTSPLAFAHSEGVVVSSLPANVVQGAIYFAVAQALTRGATSTAVQAIGGAASGGGPSTSDDYNKLAQELVQRYQRII